MTVKLERLINQEYIVNYPLPNGQYKTYKWDRARVGRKSIQEVPDEVFDWLKYNTVTLTSGKLVVVDDKEKETEILDMVEDVEEFINKLYSIEEITKLLNGTDKALKAELDKITDSNVVKLFIDVAKDVKLDSVKKQKMLADKIDIPVDVAFPTE